MLKIFTKTEPGEKHVFSMYYSINLMIINLYLDIRLVLIRLPSLNKALFLLLLSYNTVVCYSLTI